MIDTATDTVIGEHRALRRERVRRRERHRARARHRQARRRARRATSTPSATAASSASTRRRCTAERRFFVDRGRRSAATCTDFVLLSPTKGYAVRPGARSAEPPGRLRSERRARAAHVSQRARPSCPTSRSDPTASCGSPIRAQPAPGIRTLRSRDRQARAARADRRRPAAVLDRVPAMRTPSCSSRSSLRALAARARADPFVDARRVVADRDRRRRREADCRASSSVRRTAPARSRDRLDTFSLGLGGTIVVAFTDNVVVDRPGPGLHGLRERRSSCAASRRWPPFAEPGTVSVSADGVTWATFPCALDRRRTIPGCAGVYPVFANADDPGSPSPLVPSTTPIASLVGVPTSTASCRPPARAATRFDLAERRPRRRRASSASTAARSIIGLQRLAGFDLDAVAGVHSVETAGQPDTDGDGIADAADGCPLVADPAQADADGDGVGRRLRQLPGARRAPIAAIATATASATRATTVPRRRIPTQADSDGDGIGDACARRDHAARHRRRRRPRRARRLPDRRRSGAARHATATASATRATRARRRRIPISGHATATAWATPARRATPPIGADADGDGVPDANDDCPHVAQSRPGRSRRRRRGRRVRPVSHRRLVRAADRGNVPRPRRHPRRGRSAHLRVPDPRDRHVARRQRRRDAHRDDLARRAGRIGRRCAPAGAISPRSFAPLIPGSTRVLRIPLARRRTVVTLRAEGSGTGRRRRARRHRPLHGEDAAEATTEGASSHVRHTSTRHLARRSRSPRRPSRAAPGAAAVTAAPGWAVHSIPTPGTVQGGVVRRATPSSSDRARSAPASSR